MANEGNKDVRAELSFFCKDLHKNITTMIEKAKGDSEKEIVLTAYQERCNDICSDIDGEEKQSFTGSALSKYLQMIAKFVMDLTFVDECSLVDEEFPQESAYSQVTSILESLHAVESLAERIVKDKSTQDVLGLDIVECLRWRKGALLYMYCHTLNSRCSHGDLPIHFTQCLEDGVKFLTAMLSTRSSPKWLSQSSSDDADEKDGAKDISNEDDDETNKLLAQGILSDTHLLALMYCGELCYWHTKARQHTLAEKEQPPQPNENAAPDQPVTSTQDYSNSNENSEAHAIGTGDKTDCDHPQKSSMPSINEASDIDNNKTAGESAQDGCDNIKASCDTSCASGAIPAIDIVRIGQQCLQNYIRAAKGPMLAGGWNTNRAEEILQFFSSLKR